MRYDTPQQERLAVLYCIFSVVDDASLNQPVHHVLARKHRIVRPPVKSKEG